MFGLIDANSFFASCEQVFRPDLWAKPVIVLSNNDGCVVARSFEAKALGIPMGSPFFEVRDLVRHHGVAVFSANFPLYADLSARLVELYRHLFKEVYVYSVDEVFVRPDPGLSRSELLSLGKRVADLACQWIGIPVSVGFGPTKTLAKVANYMAKQNRQPVFVMPQRLDAVLEAFPIGEVWGIGRKSADKLKFHGLFTAQQFVQSSPTWVRKQLTVTGERIWQELQGVDCGGVGIDPDSKTILSSRSFGAKVMTVSDLGGSLAHHLSTAVDKLRRSGRVAGEIQVFFRTSRHDPHSHRVSYRVKLIPPTAILSEMISMMLVPLASVFQPGFRYAKSGVILSGFYPCDAVPRSLFEDGELGGRRQVKHELLQKTVDLINQKWGRSTLKPARTVLGKSTWQSSQNHRSFRYTTCWAELCQVRQGLR
jgi:DNA polymerase V